jgi:predicted amidohydrolase
MGIVRVALANIEYPGSPGDAIVRAAQAVREAAAAGALIVCFPECFVPGYRSAHRRVPPVDAAYLDRAWTTIATAAGDAGVWVILGTERLIRGLPTISALVINNRGGIEGFQDKVQIDPSEEATYSAGEGRRIFHAGTLTFGICICHEGWRYPETVRWAAKRGAQVVFHPQFHEAEAGSYRPTTFADPANTFHEKAVLCRAAENTCFFATVNYATAGAPATSAIARPSGELLAYQPYGKPGLLVADLDLSEATLLLATRCMEY